MACQLICSGTVVNCFTVEILVHLFFGHLPQLGFERLRCGCGFVVNEKHIWVNSK
ncbi:hypothetical protein OUZ56_022718 [Daphnia magna]|uniref:Uncharacterized protein n=1 Tax=Daphnia magna TaxID=35525 RepID=A0ABR0AX91_9CRUS|nr:hypothetical protein OUZ56_022718 [Daphnia magna]